MKILQATIEDLKKIAPLFAAYREFYLNSANKAETAVLSEAFLRDRLQRVDSVIFYAVDEEHPERALGFIQLYSTFSSVGALSVYTLNDLFVAEGMRRKRVAEMLVRYCIEHARSRGYSAINLETQPDNQPAQALYRKLGFEQSSYLGFGLDLKNAKKEVSGALADAMLQKHSSLFITTKLRFHDQSVVITGVTRGLGRAMVNQFVKLGWKVFGCGRDIERLHELQRVYSHCEFAQVDVTDEATVQAWIDGVVAKNGVPKLAIANASIIDTRKPLLEQESAEFRRIMDINVIGSMVFNKVLLPHMMQRPIQDGVIINMSSSWGRRADSGLAGYCASKFAVEGLTQTLRLDYGNKVGLFAMDPGGGIATDMLDQCQLSEEYLKTVPTAQEWAEKAVPFMLALHRGLPEVSVTVPKIERTPTPPMPGQ